jgi:hypothetical protein
MTGLSSQWSRVHEAVPDLLFGLEAALVCCLGSLLQAGLKLQSADAQAAQHEAKHKRCFTELRSGVKGAPADAAQLKELDENEERKWVREHAEELQKFKKLDDERRQLTEQLKEDRHTWDESVAAANKIAPAVLQLLAVLQKDLMLDVLPPVVLKNLQQQQQQQGEEEGISGRQKACNSSQQQGLEQAQACAASLQLRWKVTPLLLNIGSEQQHIAEGAAEQVVLAALDRSAASSSSSSSSSSWRGCHCCSQPWRSILCRSARNHQKQA